MFENDSDLKNIVSRLDIDTNPNPDHRDSLRRQMLSVFQQTQNSSSHAPSWQIIGRTIMKSRITKLAAAAVIIIALVVGISHFGGSIDGASVAWGCILEHIQTANTVSYKVTSQLENEPEKVSSVMYISPFLLREQILPDGKTTIWNHKERKKLVINPEKETGAVFEYVNVTQDANDLPADIKKYFYRHLWEYFRPDYEESSEFVGNEEIDGCLANIFTAKHRSGQIKVWANPKTGLPIRAEISSKVSRIDRNGIPITYILSDFVWDGYIDESLFNIEVPVGYREYTYTINVSDPTGKAMIDAFGASAQLLGGIFPSEFNDRALAKITMNSMRGNEEKPFTQDEKVAIYQKILTINAGFDFISKLQDNNDWHYYGNGIKLGDSVAIICWWRPNDSEFYRVIYGDLTVEDVAPEDLPE